MHTSTMSNNPENWIVGQFDLNEIQKSQPILNIGTLGHVSHGKSTIVKQTSGKRPQQFSDEQVRNITIQLGYANVKIFSCTQCDIYETSPGETSTKHCGICKSEMSLRLHFSYIDSPGHQAYMSTMLNGTAVMDAAIIVIGANEKIPQPQTAEHLIAAELMGITSGIVVLNKLDLVKKDDALRAHTSAKEIIKGTHLENSAFVPLCANYGFNLDILAREICKLPIPQRNLEAHPKMIVIRSFDVSKSGAPAKEVKGGVAGGSLLQGTLHVGQEIEIRPGLIFQKQNQTGDTVFVFKPIKTTVTSLFSEKTQLKLAIPGGLIGVGTKLDPALTKQNRLVGQIVGLNLPDVYDEIKLKYFAIPAFQSDKPFQKGDKILLNVHSCEITAVVLMIQTKAKTVIVRLSKPVCVDINDKVSVSKIVNQQWRLTGYATIERGKPIEQTG